MTPKCDSCNEPMELDKRLQNGKSKDGNYRRRRYKCSICDIYYTMYKNGEGDKARTREAVEKSKQI